MNRGRKAIINKLVDDANELQKREAEIDPTYAKELQEREREEALTLIAAMTPEERAAFLAEAAK